MHCGVNNMVFFVWFGKKTSLVQMTDKTHRSHHKKLLFFSPSIKFNRAVYIMSYEVGQQFSSSQTSGRVADEVPLEVSLFAPIVKRYIK